MGDGRNFVLKFGPASILVRCDGQELAGPLSEYLKGHLTDSQSWNAEIELKFSKALCPVPTRARLALRYYTAKIFYLSGHKYFTDFRSCLELEPGGKKAIGFVAPETFAESGVHFFTHTLFTLCLFEMLRHQGVFFVHCAGLVSPEGKAYLFPAGGGEGKSTLAIYLISRGYRYLSDDIVFLTRASGRVEVIGFKKLSHIAEEVMSRFPELARIKDAPSLDGKGKRIVALDRVYPNSRAESAPGDYTIIFPQRISNGSSRLKPAPAMEGFHRLLTQSPLVFIDPALAQEHLKMLRDLLGASRAWVLENGKDWINEPAILEDLLGQAGREEGKP